MTIPNNLDRLRYWIIQLAKLSSEKAEFYNPFDVSEAKKIRDFVLNNKGAFCPKVDKRECCQCDHYFTNPFDEYFCKEGRTATRVCKKFKKKS